MDFRFSSEEEAWRKEVREFFEKECSGEFVQRLIDEQGRYNAHSQELYLKMAQRGWLGLSWPKEYGGQGRSYMEQAIFIEEACRGRCPTGTMNVIGNTVHFLGNMIIEIGTKEQKETFLSKITKGELRSCQGLSEPNAGTDLASVELRAVADNDDYVLNGTKLFSNAFNANHIFTVTRTDPNVPKHRGISLFLVDLKSPGISISPLVTPGNQWRAEVAFEDVRVPRFNRLGEENQGWYNLAKAMGFERSQSQGVSELEQLLEEFIFFIKRERYEGIALCEIPAVRQAIANIAADLEVARLLSYHVVWKQSKGMDVSQREAPMAKLYTSELKERFANVAMDILGGYGLLQKGASDRRYIPLNGKIAQAWLDSRVEQIAGGTSEVQRMVSAQRGLGLPRK